MNKEQIAEDLRGGATYIRDHGWTTQFMQDDTGRTCAMGGIRCHLGTIRNTTPGLWSWSDHELDIIIELAKHVSAKEFDPDWNREEQKLYAVTIIANWNDKRAKDAEEVVTTMEKLAAKLEEVA